jgi:hypothetical protein
VRGHRAANPHSRQPSPIPTFSSFPNHLPLHSTSMSRRRPLSSPSSSRSSCGRPIFLSRSSSHGQQPPRHSSRSTPCNGAKFEHVCAPPRCKETPPRIPVPRRPGRPSAHMSHRSGGGCTRPHPRRPGCSDPFVPPPLSSTSSLLAPHLVHKRRSIGHCYCCLLWSSTLASFCLERRPSGLCPSTLFFGAEGGLPWCRFELPPPSLCLWLNVDVLLLFFPVAPRCLADSLHPDVWLIHCC